MEKDLVHKTVVDGVDVDVRLSAGKVVLEIDLDSIDELEKLKKVVPGFLQPAIDFVEMYLKS